MTLPLRDMMGNRQVFGCAVMTLFDMEQKYCIFMSTQKKQS